MAKMPDYTAAEKTWLKEHGHDYVNSFAAAEAFAARFGYVRSAQGIRATLHTLCPESRYGWSGGLRKGEGRSVTARAVGSERKVGGFWYIKISRNPLPKNYSTAQLRACWVQKHRYLWEKAHGERVPRDNVVIFLDGDRDNMALDNLYCTTRKVIAMMGRNNWFTDCAEYTLTAIKLCELHFALNTAEAEAKKDNL